MTLFPQKNEDTTITSKKTKPTPQVIIVSDLKLLSIGSFLEKLGMKLCVTEDSDTIPGSFWGDSEAGLIHNQLYVRKDTPIHSLLHETCHYLCMDDERKNNLHTDAGGDYDEENAVCYLQIVLADNIPGYSSERCMMDMDSWGYTFRLGSTQRWFEEDAEDAKQWLVERKLYPST